MLFLFIIFNISLVSSIEIEDLQSVFGNKHCIEASLVSISTQQKDPILIDSSTGIEETLLINTSSKETDKSITSKVHELAQYNNVDIVYKLISEAGPPHAKTFIVHLMLGDEKYEGSGSSLKKAKQEAAKMAIENTFYEHPPEKIKEVQENSLTPTVILNNIAMKLGIGVSYHLLNGQEEQAIDGYGASDEAYGKSKSMYPKINSTTDFLRIPVEDPQITGPFMVKVQVGDIEFKGIGHTKQGARHDAALKAIKHLEKKALIKDNVCANDDSVEECKEMKESLKSPITRVYEAGQKHGLSVEFNIVSETGKSHKKIFVTECRLGDFVTEGEASSKKQSKALAAENMLQYLSQLPEVFSVDSIVSGLSKKKKKRKKNKIIKDNVNTIMSGISLASSLWSSGDEISTTDKSHNMKKTTPTRSFKNKLLEMGRKLNIPIEFTDLTKHEDKFLSLLSLEMQPKHLCLGKAATRESSHESASLHGLKFLKKLGLLDEADYKEFKLSDEFDDVELDEKSTYVLEEVETSR